jgi:hypothetical protein
MVSNATKLTIAIGSGSAATTVDVTGTSSYTVSPTSGTTYTLTAANAAGLTTAAQVTVQVEDVCLITSFTANPATIASGHSTTLTDEETGVCTKVIVTGEGVLSSEQGTTIVVPASTTTYTLTGNNDTGATATAALTVHVTPSVFYFTASSPSVGVSGNSVTLSWQTGAATSLSLAATSGGSTTTTNVSGTTSLTVTPNVTTTYVLTASSNEGSTSSLPVTVTKTTALTDITSFLAYQTSTVTTSTSAVASTYSGGTVYLIPVFAAGDTATIKDAAGNSYCTSAVTSGTACAVRPTATTTYALTVTNPAYKQSQSQTLRVVVGDITAFSGVGNVMYSNSTFSDGGAAYAQFEVPRSLATDSAGNVYFADSSACVVEKLDTGGNATRAAGIANDCATGSGPNLYPVDGNALTQATFGTNLDGGLAIDPAGDIFVGDENAGEIRKISAGVVSTPAGSPYLGNTYVDGVGSAAGFGNGITGVALDSLGELIVADGPIRVMDGTGKVTTLAGDPTFWLQPIDGTGRTGNGANTALVAASGIAIDTSIDTIYLAAGTSIRVMTPDKSTATAACPGAACWTWTVTTWINPSGTAGYVDGPAATAKFESLSGIARASDGTLFVADWSPSGSGIQGGYSSYIRRITPSGVVDTIAGNGSACAFGKNYSYSTMCTLPNSSTSSPEPLPGVVFGAQGIAVDPTQNRLFFDVSDVTSIYTLPY